VDESCERFVEWCTPLLTADELAATETAVAAFLRPDGPGRRLHAALEKYNADEGLHSWLDTFFSDRYLCRRGRIAVDTNFFFLFEDADQPQVERAAGLIAAAINYKVRLDEELVPPDVSGGQPLSMEQNKSLFSTTRIPGSVRDAVRAPYTHDFPGPSRARHIAVFFGGNIFRMDVLGSDGRPYTLDDLAAGLRAIMTAGAVRAALDASVGHLTTTTRAVWAANRDALLALAAGNAEALDEVETALFCLCLEDFAPKDTLAACDHLLHGDSGNRWFDKSVSLIVFADGRAGINVEHSGLDGSTILSFVDTMLGTPAEEHSRQSGAQSQGLPAAAAIEFVLDEGLRAEVRNAAATFAAYRSDIASAILSFAGFGADRVKQLGMSPDAFVQMAFQLAHRRARGVVGATYESIATRQYRRGRTGAMRVVTAESIRLVAAIDDPDADLATRRAALWAAAQMHRQRARQCQSGHGPEHHLDELQLLQKRRGNELGVTEPPTLYQSPGWLKMRDDYLSTSAVPTMEARHIGFGPTGAQCIGIAYRLLANRLDLYLSAPRPIAEDLTRFVDKLPAAMRELEDLLDGERPKG
jgi:carnitine O-acetyltransferase